MRHIISSGLTGVAVAAFFSSVAFAGNYGGYGGYGGSSYNNHDNDYYYEKKRQYKKKYYKKKTYQNKKASNKKAVAPAVAFPALANNKDTSLPVLTDKKGMTLYIFDKDKYGVSSCYNDCAAGWPPYLAKKGATARENFSLVLRKDGKQQWAYKGKPLYYWAADKKAGDIKGDGVGGVWHILRSEEFAQAPEAVEKAAEEVTENEQTAEVAEEKAADILTDEKKMTLYIFDKDKSDLSNCYEDCAVSWPPYFVPEKAEAKENFTIVLRKDGKRQWAYKGKPLYYWAGDQKPGDKTGDGVGGVWHIVKI